MDEIVSIEKLVHGGRGLARTNNGVVFVSDVAPGEKVRIVPDETIGGQACAKAVEIIEPAACRREPSCEYFGKCGGCDWLHISYDAQLSIKHDIFIESLERIGKIKLTRECGVFPSPEFEYRQRCQFKIDLTAKSAGFYKRKSQSVVAIKRCPLLVPQLNALLEKLPEAIASMPSGAWQIKAIAGSNGKIAASPHLENVTSYTTIMQVGADSFMVSGDSFFQGNIFLTEKLGTWALDALEGDFCVDLYGGVGFLSVLLGKRFKCGVLVDNINAQVKLARINFENNTLTNFTAQSQSVEDFLYNAAKSKTSLDCCILDPPRPGISQKVREGIERLAPRTILSVSCNPSTQARDIGFFVNKCGYSIAKAGVFDLYPNTHHIETAVVLRK